MARRHKGIIAIGAIIVGVGIIGAGVIGTLGTTIFGWFAGEEEVVAPPPASGFAVSVAKAAPTETKQPARNRPPPTTENQRKEVPTGNKQPPPKTQTDLWWEGVNKGGMYTAEFDNKQVAGGAGSYGGGGCNITQPVQVYAMLAMNATTDEPGLAIGGVSEDIQGERLGGEPCVAIPMMGSIVTMTVAGAGEYATSKAPVTVDEIYLPSIDGGMGEVIKVGQKAAAYDGIPGIEGKANHHIMSKTIAGGAAVLFRALDNATRFGSVNVSSGDATDPLADALQKTLDRPSEIVLSKSGYGFTLKPVTTIGY